MNKLKIYENSHQFRSSGIEFLTVNFKVSSFSNQNSAFFQLPINMEPTGGSVGVFPNIGYSLDTSFYLSAVDWIDENLPLSYIFSYSYGANGEYRDLTYKQGDPFTFTQLVAPVSGSIVYLKVKVFDSLDSVSFATTAVNVEKRITSNDPIEETKNSLELILKIDPLESFLKLSLLFQNLANWIEAIFTQTSPGCPVCSGHGVCINNRCVCNPGFSLPDCSYEVAKIEEIMSAKLYLARKAESAMNIANVSSMRGLLMDSIKKTSNDIIFTRNATLEGFQGILASMIDKNLKGFLQDDELKDMAEILDNFLSYAAETDCGIETDFTKNLEQITNDYLETISVSSLYEKIPSEPAFVFHTENFHVYTQKVPLCLISALSISTGPQTPIIQLFPKNNTEFTSIDCLTEITIKYYLFENNIFNCEDTRILAQNVNKSLIAMEIADSATGLELDSLEAVIQMAAIGFCPEGCDQFEEGSNLCKCLDLRVFDTRKQISSIFQNSRANYITNISAISDSIWENVALWSLIFFTIWFMITLYIVRKKTPNYCIFEGTKLADKSTLSKIKLLILATHPLLGMYLYKNPYISKTRRAILYYTRMSLLLAYSSLFANLNGKQEINIFYVLFNYVTVLPLYSVLHYFLQGIREDEKDVYRGRTIRYKRYIGTGLALAVMVACNLIALIISSQLTGSEKRAWMTYLIISLIQDIFVSPFILLTIRLCIIRAFSYSVKNGWEVIAVFLNKIMNKKTEETF